MTDATDDTATDHDATEAAPAAPSVRIPNVRPGAVSGLDHTLLSPDAAAAAAEDPQDDTPTLDVPDGDLDAQLAWVKDAESDTDRTERADAVWAKASAENTDEDYLADVAAQLRETVNGSAEEIAAAPDLPEPSGEVATDADGLVPEADGELVVPEEGVFDWIESAESSDEQADRATAAYRKAAAEAAEPGEEYPDEYADHDEYVRSLQTFRDNLLAEYGGIIAPQDSDAGPTAEASTDDGKGGDPEPPA